MLSQFSFLLVCLEEVNLDANQNEIVIMTHNENNHLDSALSLSGNQNEENNRKRKIGQKIFYVSHNIAL